jgi:hypothetical protein
MGSHLKINDYEISLINEISAISTHSPATVRNILESAFLRQMESLLAGEDISLPFIGTVSIKYKGDDYVSGSKLANFDPILNPSELFVRLVGEAHDGESNIIWQLSEKRIKSASQKKLEE